MTGTGARRLGFALIAATVAACSFVTVRSGIQCESNDDCTAKGGDFAFSRCSDGVCERITTPEASAAAVGCRTSEDCIFSAGRLARCVDGTCVGLSITGCQPLEGATDDGAVLLGVLTPWSGAAAAEVRSTAADRVPHDLVQEIVRQWNSAVADAGVPALPRFGLIGCDETALGDPTDGDAILKKLVDVRVAALVGPMTEDRLATVLEKTLVPVFAPFGEETSGKTPPRRAWSCYPARKDAAAAFSRAADLIAQKLTSDRGLDGGAFEPKMVFVTENADEDAFEREAGVPPAAAVSVVGSFDPLNETSTVLATAAQVVNQTPDLVLVGGPWIAGPLIEAIEARWGPVHPSSPRPYYLLMPSLPSVEEALNDLGGRTFALNWSRNTEVENNYQRFLALLNGAQIDKEPFLGASLNDCLYTAMYGVAAAAAVNGIRPTSVTATHIEAAVPRVSTGNPGDFLADLVPERIRTTLSVLSAGSKVSLVGASEVLTFNPGTGFTPAPPSQLDCVGTTNGRHAKQWTFAGVRFNGQDAGVTGEIACP